MQFILRKQEMIEYFTTFQTEPLEISSRVRRNPYLLTKPMKNMIGMLEFLRSFGIFDSTSIVKCFKVFMCSTTAVNRRLNMILTEGLEPQLWHVFADQNTIQK